MNRCARGMVPLALVLLALAFSLSSARADEPCNPRITSVEHWWEGGSLSLRAGYIDTATWTTQFPRPVTWSLWGLFNPAIGGADGSCLVEPAILTLTPSGCGKVGAPSITVIPPPDTQPKVEVSIAPPGMDSQAVIVDYDFPASNQIELWAIALPSGNSWYTTSPNSTRPKGRVQAQVIGTPDDVRVLVKARSCGVREAQDLAVLESAHEDCEKCEDKCTDLPLCAGDPVRTFGNNMRYEDIDPVPAAGFLPLRRIYNSRSQSTGGVFGPRWSSLFDARLSTYDDPRDNRRYVTVVTERHDALVFEGNGGVYTHIPGDMPGRAKVTFLADNTWLQTDADGRMARIFDVGGFPIAYREIATGREVRMTWSGDGLPVRVEDSWGNFAWTVTTDPTSRRITSIAVEGRPDLVWSYSYNTHLTTVQSPEGTWRTYEYAMGLFAVPARRLVVARDGAGNQIEQHNYEYSNSGRSNSSIGPGGEIEWISIIHDGLTGRNDRERRTLVQYKNGRTETHYLRFVRGQWRTVEIQGGCSSCGQRNAVLVYGATGNAKRVQRADGYVTENTYSGKDLIRTRTPMRPVGCDPSADVNHCMQTVDTLAEIDLQPTAETTTTDFTYGDANWPERATTTTTTSAMDATKQRIETVTYDAATGEVLSSAVSGWTGVPARLESRVTTTALYDGTEGAAFAPGGAFSASWISLPQPAGMRKSVDGPRIDVADVTHVVYYPIDDAVPATWRGQLAATRNAAGHIVRFEEYDVFGHAARVVDPNGVVQGSVIDRIGRTTEQKTGAMSGCDTLADPLCNVDLVERRTYSGAGPLQTEQRPGGGVTSYEYDSRGRVHAIMRGPSATDLRERIEYEYDPSTGKKSLERFLARASGAWVEKKRLTYVYDLFEQVQRVVQPDSAATHYTYDSAGRVSTVRDENHSSPNTSYTYDAAGRLRRVQQTLSTAAGGSITTLYGYDLHGNLTSVTDPNGNVTTYLYDDFGQMLRQTSPVTGVTTYAYDRAGQLLTTTLVDALPGDGRDTTTTTTRAYDALGRVLSSSSVLAGQSQSVSWSYDTGTFGKGRLASMTDPTGTTAYAWDRRGLLLSETKTIGGAIHATRFGYDADGNRSRIVYPSGRVVDYGFDFASRPMSAITGETMLVTSASYLPFGPLAEIAFGNGTTRTMTYDPRYRPLTNMLTGPLLTGEDEPTTGVIASYEYTHDPAGNITRIADLADPAYDRDFGYDDLHRLTTANGGPGLWGAGSYQYDAMGNVRSTAVGGNLRTFTMSGTTPKIASVMSDGRVDAVAYDQAGNEIAAGARTYEYSPRNHLRSAGDHLYEYDGRGIRTTTVYTVTLAALSLDVAIASPNQTVTGTVSLTTAAPAGGVSVRLSSSSGAVAVPSEILVAAGEASATFTATVNPEAEAGMVTLTATYATSLSATLTISESPALSVFTATPSEVIGGNAITAEVTLAEAAPEGGAVVVIIPEREQVASGTITIAAGGMSGATVLDTYPSPRSRSRRLS